MFARVTTVQAPPDRIEESARVAREQALPAMQGRSGFKGMYYLVDRENGRGLGITLWETEEDLLATEEQAKKMRATLVERGASGLPTARVYEVSFQSTED
jgi:heme-degrading monooxygenase HmoA